MPGWQVKNVTILGAGVSGKAAAKLCAANNINCTVVSDGGGAVLPDGELIVVSPGVHPAKSALYQAALASGREIVSEMEFGCRFWHKPLLAVTGTNGKTTTTELTAFLLQQCGVKAECCGNIGRPLSDLAAEAGVCEVAVIEVSSFQLEKVRDFAPFAGVILNFQSDHIDRYPGGFAEYCATKERMFEHIQPENRIYGLSFAGKKRRVTLAGRMLLVDGKDFFDLDRGDLPGAHNAENAAAAVELCLRFLPEKCVWSGEFRAALEKFRRGRHRVEVIGVRNGVTYVDDSKGTNPAAVLAAIDSLPGKLVILLGGLGKGMDFSPLATRAERFRAAVLYGADRAEIAKVLAGKCRCVDCGSDFAVVMKTAKELAHPGDTVLLSPACASMDMFKNYAERGDTFALLFRQNEKC
ncbi:MAG: UDP-N-acetylmuramoyl-L-alanine--D-glutamate ligase [Lentisphaerae bacterium]|nr:UDP-N-acetylmuramoyl-L-alanine--D-glutamate ligase [Lentisphaerota bacterium]